MIAKFIKRRMERRAERQRSYRTLLAGALSRKLNETGELTINRALQIELGAPHHELLHTAYELALQEEIHIMAENDGIVRLMSNQRFEQMTREYASAYTTTRIGEALRNESGRWEESTVEPLSVIDPESEMIFIDEAALMEPITENAPREPEWQYSENHGENDGHPSSWVENAGFVVADGKESRGNMPEERKTLPLRERDPWSEFDEIKFPRIKDKKKSK